MRMKLPFSINRSSRIKLPYQVANGLRSAIQSGEWKPGERLPSLRELKAELKGVGTDPKEFADKSHYIRDLSWIPLF